MAQTTLSYTGSIQTFDVPADVHHISVDLRGGKGGAGGVLNAQAGGNGGRLEGILTVTPGETLNIWVGGVGLDSSGGVGGGAGVGGTGGGTGGSAGLSDGGGGGGSSDIRQGGTALTDRKCVAGAGGGGANAGVGIGGGGSLSNEATTATQPGGGGANGTALQHGGGAGGGGWVSAGGGAISNPGGGGSNMAHSTAMSNVTSTPTFNAGAGAVILTYFKEFSVSISGAVDLTPAYDRSLTSHRTATGSLTLTGAFEDLLTLFKEFSATITFDGTYDRTLTLFRAYTATVDLAAQRVVRKTSLAVKSAAITLNGVRQGWVIRLGRDDLEGTLNLNGTVGRALRKNVSATLDLVAAYAKALTARRTFSGEITFSPAWFVKLPQEVLNRMVGGGTTLVRRFIRIFED